MLLKKKQLLKVISNIYFNSKIYVYEGYKKVL